MTTANIRFSSSILRRLGEELNLSPDAGIIELVKNSYDANALDCTVSIDQSAESWVSILDNGDGMDAAAIRDWWLVLGSSGKTSRPTRLGRLPVGNKGLGRLAALRLGTTATLRTRPFSSRSRQYSLAVHWNQFDKARTVEDVKLEIIEADIPRGGFKHGTEIVIRNLRSPLSQQVQSKLSRDLLLLPYPQAEAKSPFRLRLRSESHTEMKELFELSAFKDADYALVARLDAEGKATAELRSWNGRVIASAEHKAIVKAGTGAPYGCPSAHFEFFTFVLGGSFSMKHSLSLSEVRKWVTMFGGVHIYKNGMRVSPYGDVDDDWLELNLARVRSPEERPSTNNSFARLSVTDTTNALAEKTDRSGFLLTEVFKELKRFAKDSLDWMAKVRLKAAQGKRDRNKKISRAKAERAKDELLKSIRDLEQSGTKKPTSEVRRSALKYQKARDREVSLLESEVALNRTLSTAGILAAAFAHEAVGGSLKTIALSTMTMRRILSGALTSRSREALNGNIDHIEQSRDVLNSLSKVTLSLLSPDKRASRIIPVGKSIQKLVSVLQPLFERRKVALSVELCNPDTMLSGSEAAIEVIVANLLVNAMHWARKSRSRGARVLLRQQISGEQVLLTVSDTGPGISGIKLNDVWLPGISTRDEGTGLGLALVRDTVMDLGGEPSVKAHGELGGAEFSILLPTVSGSDD